MLERMIVGFAAWFIRPLGYEVVPVSGLIKTSHGDIFICGFKDGNYTLKFGIGDVLPENVIKVDFKA